MLAATHATEYPLCHPISPEHQRGLLWFWHLLSVSHPRVIAAAESLDTATAHAQLLARSREFYNLYAQTGEPRYLSLCEDFLRDGLRQPAAARLRAQP